MRMVTCGSLCLLLLVTACRLELNTSHIRIGQLVNLPPDGPVMIRVSEHYDLQSAFPLASYSFTAGSDTDLVLRNIRWRGHDRKWEGQDFWLLIAIDVDQDGRLSPGDYLLPAMNVRLFHNQETELQMIQFPLTLTDIEYDPLINYNYYQISVECSQPAAITPTTAVYIAFSDTPAPPTPGQFSFGDSQLVRRLVVRSTINPIYILAWLDLDGNGSLSSGDWISAPEDAADEWASLNGNPLLLSPLQIQP